MNNNKIEIQAAVSRKDWEKVTMLISQSEDPLLNFYELMGYEDRTGWLSDEECWEDEDGSDAPMITNEGLISIVQGLKNNHVVRKVHLYRIDPDDMNILADMLENNKHLVHLDLYSNYLGSQTGALGRVLQINDTLKKISLSHNLIKYKPVIAMAAGLTKNDTLLELDLSFNKIDDRGAIILADMLTVNKKLKILDLHSNQIGDAGAIALLNALKINTTLIRLDLGNNKIKSDYIIAIGDIIEENWLHEDNL